MKETPPEEYISLLDIGGTLVYLGIPRGDLPSLPLALMVGNNLELRGSNTDNKMEGLQMHELAIKSKIKKWIKVMPMTKRIEKLERRGQRY
jgi:alcohol dehydrogenase (NADP+)